MLEVLLVFVLYSASTILMVGNYYIAMSRLDLKLLTGFKTGHFKTGQLGCGF